MDKERQVALIRALQAGNTAVEDEFFSGIYNDVYYFAFKTVKDQDLAADITQESLIEVFSKLNDLQDPVAFPAWCRQITYHQCTRHFRKKTDALLESDGEDGSLFDTVEEDSADYIPDEALDRKDLQATILSFIDTLSEEQRSAVMMYYFDELSVAQIAEIQGVSPGTVKSRLNYARKAIKALVEEYEKKHDIKLHALSFFPLFRLLFAPEKAATIAPTSAVSSAATAVSAQTGVALSAGTAATAVTASSTAAATAVAGTAAKAATPLAVKLVAGVLAATVAIGGGTAGAILLANRRNAPVETGGKHSTKTSVSETNGNYIRDEDGDLVCNPFAKFGTNFTLQPIDPVVIQTQDPFFGVTQNVNVWVYLHVYPEGGTLFNVDTGQDEHFEGPVVQMEVQMPFPFGNQRGPIYSCLLPYGSDDFKLKPLAGDNQESIRLQATDNDNEFLLTAVFSEGEDQTVRLTTETVEEVTTTSTSTTTTTTSTTTTTTTTTKQPQKKPTD